MAKHNFRFGATTGRAEFMRALFVHGMGRSPLSGGPLLWHLKRRGLSTSTFWYSTAFENFEAIKARLVARLIALARQGDYVVIGHSLGGVLLREAIASLPQGTLRPKRLFFLATPVSASNLARRFRNNLVYRALTGDCGQLLGSDSRMTALSPVSVPTTAIVGTRGLPWKPDPFRGESNDGVVSLSEVSADWIHDRVQIHIVHTLLPASRMVAEAILGRLAHDEP
jgi:pimeloyl-ACP methyl ester carboxylesterase